MENLLHANEIPQTVAQNRGLEYDGQSLFHWQGNQPFAALWRRCIISHYFPLRMQWAQERHKTHCTDRRQPSSNWENMHRPMATDADRANRPTRCLLPLVSVLSVKCELVFSHFLIFNCCFFCLFLTRTTWPWLHPWRNHGSSLCYCHEKNALCCFFA